MHERPGESRGGRLRRRLGPASLSIAAHVGAFGVLVSVGAWRVDKLDPVDPPILFHVGFAPRADSGEVAGPPKPAPPHTRRVTRATTQPEPKTPAAEQPPGDGEPDDDHAGGGGDEIDPSGRACPPGADCSATPADQPAQPVCGNGVVEPGEECDDGGRAASDGCSAACRVERETVVGAHLIEGHRISGDPQIPAPERVRTQMMRSGQPEVVGTVKMCLAKDGAVRSLRVMRSTGYAEYDNLLTSRMQRWLYHPYQLADGTRVPVCTVVTFIYRME